MNIAFPALLLFILVLPGFICRFTYYESEKTDLNNQAFSIEGVLSFILSIVLHLIWMGIAHVLGRPVDTGHVLSLLSHSSETAVTAALSNAADNIRLVSIYFLSLYFVAWALGLLAQTLVKYFSLDINGTLSFIFKFDTPWYYQLKGRVVRTILRNGELVQELVYLDKSKPYVMVTCAITRPDDTYLYRGILDDFFLKRDGNLDRLVLSAPMRRKLSADSSPELYEIPGDAMIIKYDDVSSMNIEYMSLPNDIPPPEAGRQIPAPSNG